VPWPLGVYRGPPEVYRGPPEVYRGPCMKITCLNCQLWFTRVRPTAHTLICIVNGDDSAVFRFLSVVILTFDLWPWHSNSSEWGTKHVLPVNLAQIRSAVPEIFHTQTENKIVTYSTKTERYLRTVIIILSDSRRKGRCFLYSASYDITTRPTNTRLHMYAAICD